MGITCHMRGDTPNDQLHKVSDWTILRKLFITLRKVMFSVSLWRRPHVG